MPFTLHGNTLPVGSLPVTLTCIIQHTHSHNMQYEWWAIGHFSHMTRLAWCVIEIICKAYNLMSTYPSSTVLYYSSLEYCSVGRTNIGSWSCLQPSHSPLHWSLQHVWLEKIQCSLLQGYSRLVCRQLMSHCVPTMGQCLHCCDCRWGWADQSSSPTEGPGILENLHVLRGNSKQCGYIQYWQDLADNRQYTDNVSNTHYIKSYPYVRS